MTRAALEAKVIAAWREAAESLGVRIVAPFSPPSEPLISCIAHLPDFGGPNGMVVGGAVPPEFWTDKVLSRWAESAGLYVSFLNLKRYSKYDDAFFREALKDWGFYGPPSIKPPWLQEK